jgi:hypothetical protein
VVSSLLTFVAMAGLASVVYLLVVSLVEKTPGRSSLAVRWFVAVILLSAAYLITAELWPDFLKSGDVFWGFFISSVLTPMVHRAIRKRWGRRLA